MKYIFGQADQITTAQKQAKVKFGGAEREDILEARQRMIEEQPKKEEEYYINQYGIRKLVNPPERPKPEKKKGRRGRGQQVQPVV